ncbi:MAG TPA: endonuclease/exonuclease/phosphatase family protein [Steroidobacteraceae bacterium]|nr:endonuclease/exonuclease/phosphatase family protein [Steroidobacteraceae bacterium]HRX89112.1 endonuclease/exonuclease/phosphatase family protein [Steroidobacteraceae bacterium]
MSPRIGVRTGLVLLALAAVATVLAGFARFAWLADLAVNFRLHFALAALAAAALLAIGRSWRGVASAGLVLLVNAWYIAVSIEAPQQSVRVWGGQTAHASSSAPNTNSRPPLAVRIAAANVFHSNHEFTRLFDWLRAEQPDVISIEEVSAAWLTQLVALEADYPYRKASPFNGRFQTVMLSRWPIDVESVPRLATANSRNVEAVVRVRGTPIRVIAVHATWPLTPAHAVRRNREYAGFASGARTVREPLVLIGDFNSSALSPHFQSTLLADAGLRSAAAGYGWQPTWPVGVLPLGIQIDHALVSPQLEVVAFRRGPEVGSDHRPIVVDLELLDGPAVAVAAHAGR